MELATKPQQLDKILINITTMNHTIITLIIVFYLLSSTILEVNGQKKSRKSKKKPDYKKKYHCLVCLSDYANKKINFKDTCINPAVNVTDAETRWLTVCPADTNYCAYELHTINDVFTAIERRCATSCVPNCYTERYGTEKTACTYCCQKSIKPEDFNDDTVSDYICADLLNHKPAFISISCWTIIAPVLSLKVYFG